MNLPSPPLWDHTAGDPSDAPNLEEFAPTSLFDSESTRLLTSPRDDQIGIRVELFDPKDRKSSPLHLTLKEDQLLSRGPEDARSLGKKRIEETYQRLEGDGPEVYLISILREVLSRETGQISLFEAEIDSLEERIFADSGAMNYQAIFQGRRPQAEARKRVRHLRELFSHLLRIEKFAPLRRVRDYLRDLQAEVVHLEEEHVSLRELRASLRDLAIAREGQLTNDTMKVLSLAATVFLPLNTLTGLYGTNFQVLPLAEFPNAFEIFCVSLVVLGLLTAWYLKARLRL